MKRVISMIMVLAMLVSLIPVNVSAEDLQEESSQEAAQQGQPEQQPDEVLGGNTQEQTPEEGPEEGSKEPIPEEDLEEDSQEQMPEEEPEGPTILTWEAYRYTLLADGSVSICGFEGAPENEEEPFLVKIPSEMNGSKVTELAEKAFAGNAKIEGVLLPKTIAAIGSGAFEDCKKLKVIAFCGEAPAFGKSLVKNCELLEEIFILKDQTFSALMELLEKDLGEEAARKTGFRTFENGDSLTAAFDTLADVPETAPSDEISDTQESQASVLSDSEAPTSILASGTCGTNQTWALDSEGTLTISGSGKMSDFSSGDDVPWWFMVDNTAGCIAPWNEYRDTIKYLVIDKDITSIGKYAFLGLTALEDIYFNAVAMDDLEINNCAFCNAGVDSEGITVTIGSLVEKIPANLFLNCYYQEGVASLYDCNLTELTFEDESICASIGNSAFKYCEALVNIEIGESIKSLSGDEFYGCRSIEKIFFNAIAMEDSGGVFSHYQVGNDNKGFTATIGESVTQIPGGLFSHSNISELIFCGNSQCESINNYAFENCNLLTKVTIPETVESIGWGAFSDCSGLVCAGPAGGEYNYEFYWIDAIPANAFNGCTGLTSVMIPDTVTTIGECAFSDCSQLTSISIPDTVITIGESAFTNCSGLTSVLIPAAVTSIGSSAFNACSSLTSITIPDSITSIEKFTFRDCSMLTSITIPENVKEIKESAFSGCDYLSDVYFAGNEMQWNAISIDSTNTILANATIHYADTSTEPQSGSCGENLFWALDKNGVLSISGTGAMDAHASEDEVPWRNYTHFISKLEIGENVTSLSEYAFSNCTALTQICFNAVEMEDLPLTSRTFYKAGTGNSGISLCIGKNVTKIPANLFQSCYLEQLGESEYYCVYTTNLTSVYFESGSKCVSIGASAFEYCDKLTYIEISESIESIEENAFSDCGAITEIQFNATAMNDIGYVRSPFEGAGCNRDGITLTVGANVTRIPGKLFYCAQRKVRFKSVVFESGSVCSSIGGYSFSRCDFLTSFTIPASVENMGYGVFAGCSGLTDAGPYGGGYSCEFPWTTAIPDKAFYNAPFESISFPEELQSIGESAFMSCSSLTSVVIPNGVTKIGESAFSNCTNISYLQIPASVKSIGSSAFQNTGLCTAGPIGGGFDYEFGWTEEIPSYAFDGISLESYELPSTISKIGNYAFYRCESLETITIPEDTNEIGSYAFADCVNVSKIEFFAKEMSDLDQNDAWNSIVVNSAFADVGTNTTGICVVVGPDVTKIPAWLFSTGGRCQITKVIFPDNSVCTQIGDGAFYKQTLLREINLPNSIINIGNKSFCYCSGLTELTIPENVKSISTNAFSSCTGLTSINFNASAMDNLNYNAPFTSAGTEGDGIAVTIGTNVTRIPGGLFYSGTCAKITSIEFLSDSNCTSIGTWAFYGCAYLTSIKIPSSVVEIGSSAFKGCTCLQTAGYVGGNTNIEFAWKEMIPAYAFSGSELIMITIPESVTEIGENAFYQCSGLTEITIPKNVKVIGKKAFCDCKNLVNISFNATSANDMEPNNSVFSCTGKDANKNTIIKIGSSVSRIPAYLFRSFANDPGAVSLTFEEGSRCASIGEGAFYNVSKLLTLTLPESVVSIGECAFYNCSGLEKITIPSSVVDIGMDVFYGCNNITNAGPIGGGYNYEFGWTETIPANAFYNCSNLTDITLPESIKSIGSYAFNKCTGLTEITIPKNVRSVGIYAFSDCSGVEKLCFDAASMNDFENSNYVFSNLGSKTEGVTVTIGTNVTNVPNYLFCPYVSESGTSSGSPNVTAVVFDEVSSCKRIGAYAFYGCTKLPEIELPGSVSSIGAYAFNGCKIKSVANKLDNVCENAFFDCSFDSSIVIPSIIVNEGTTSIRKDTIYGTGLTSITIPASVTVIEDNVFGDTSSLADVYYGGSEAQWAAIKIGTGNASLTNATIHYNCDVPDTSGEVRYFSSWDEENQIAYFDTDPDVDFLNFGCQVTEETDTSFLENVDNLVGTFVLVETKSRDDGMIGPGILLSIKALETYTGTITAISTTDGTIVIDGVTYSYIFDWLEAVPEVGDNVKYHLYEGKLVSLEIIESASALKIRYFSSWDEENRAVYFGRDVQSMAVVTDITDTSFLDELDSLIGKYVLVEVNVVDDAAELVSIKAVQTNAGTVSAVDATTVTIDGATYNASGIGVLSAAHVDDFILYHIYENEIVAVEVLDVLIGELMGWNSETREISITLDDVPNLGAISYALSDLADVETVELLNKLSSGNTTIVTAIQFTCDEQGFVYFLKEAPKGDEIVGFNPEVDGWSFRNNYDGFGYGNPYRISEKRYEEVFGASYVASAKASNEKIFNSMMPEWFGNCYGMSVTALLFYLDNLEWNNYCVGYNGAEKDYPTVNSYFSLLFHDKTLYVSSWFDTVVTKLIERYQILQSGTYHGYKCIDSTCDAVDSLEYRVIGSDSGYESYYIHNPGGNYIQTLLNKIRESDVPLIICMGGSKGGHAVVVRTDREPEQMDDGTYRVYIYDPNHPYLSNEIISEYSNPPASYYSNGIDLYIELYPGINQWRYCGSVNGSSADGYWGSNEKWEVLYYKTDEGKTFTPEYVYACSIENVGLPLQFDGTEKWLSKYQNEVGFVLDGYVDIYTDNGILICSVENGIPVTCNEEVEFTPYIGVIGSGDPTAQGKITIPYSQFVVEYKDTNDISIIGFENIINIESSGNITMHVSTNDGQLKIIGNEDTDIVVQITNVYSNSEYTSIIANGMLSEGDTVVLTLDDDQFSASISGDSELSIYTDNNENPDGQYIMLLDESDGVVHIEDIRKELPEEHNHSYMLPAFDWSGNNTCTATFACIGCNDAQTVDCTVTSVTIPSTGTEAGKTVYTATVEFNGQTYTDTVTIADSCEIKINVDGIGLNASDEVWIDGVEYSVQSDDNGLYVALPCANARTMVTYSYNNPNATDVHTKYPTGMKVWTLVQENGVYTAKYVPELDNLLQYSGSSIRITGNKGIRMITSINQNTRNALTGNGLAGFKLLEYGTLLAQASKLGDDPLVLGGANVKSNYAYKKGVADPVFKYTDGLIQYTNVLVGFTEENCKEDIAMRPYIKLEDENGEVVTIYGGIVYRSIGYIAYQNRKAFPVGSAAYEYVWNIIHYVYGNQYDADYKK